MEHSSEFEWRREGEEAEAVVHAPDAERAEAAFRRALPATGLPGVESPVYAMAAVAASGTSNDFGLVAASRTHAAPDLVGAPDRGLLLVADAPVDALGVPPGELPRLVARRLAEAVVPSIGDAEVRALAEEGAVWTAEAGLVEEEDLPYLLAPSGTPPGDPEALGRRALLAGPRYWARPGRVGVFRVAEVLDADGAGELGLDPGSLAFVVLAGAEDLGRLAIVAHRERISARVASGADLGSTRDLPAAPRDTEEARDLVSAATATANYAAGRAALLVYALRRSLGDIAGALDLRAGWTVGGLAETGGLLLHRSALGAVGEGDAIVSGRAVAVGTGAALGSAPPFGTPETDDGGWPWEEAGLLVRWAALSPAAGPDE